MKPTREQLLNALRKADAAGDTPAAQAIARRIKSMDAETSNTPVTEEPEAPEGTVQFMGLNIPDYMIEQSREFDEQYKQNERDTLSAANELFRSGSNAISMGAAGLAQRHGGALADLAGSRAFGDEESREMGYSDFVERIQAEQDESRKAHPIANVAGTVLGSVGGAMLGGGALKTLADDGVPLAARAVNTLGGRMLSAGLGGGAQNLGIALGQGDVASAGNAASEFALGGILGMAGQGVGEAANRVGRGVMSHLPFGLGKSHKAKAAQREVARSLMESRPGRGSVAAYANNGKGYTPDQLLDLASQAGNGRMLAEADPRLLDTLGAYAGAGATTGMTGDVVEMAARRQAELAESAPNVLLDNLAGAIDRPAPSLADNKFAPIFDQGAGPYVPVVSKDDMVNGLAQIRTRTGAPLLDPRNRAGASKRIVETLQRQLNDVSDADGLTLKGLQNLKLQLDDMIDWSPNSSSADKLNAMDAIALKDYVNETIKRIDSRYEQAAAEFADVKAAEKLVKKGRSLLGGTNNSAPLEEVSAYLQSLDAGELAEVRSGAAKWLRGQVKQNPNYLRKIAQENPALMERMQLILGDVFTANGTSLAEVAQSVGNQLDRAGQYANVERQALGQARHTLGPDVEGVREIQSLLDVARVGFDAMHGVLGGGAVASGRRAVNSGPEMFQRQMMEWLTQANPEQATQLTNELIKLFNQPNATLRPGMVGSGLAAGLSSILDQ